MIRPIVLYGSPILRQKATPVDFADPALPQLIEDLWDTMYNAEGVGLAAPQIGVSKQAFVIDAKALQETDEPPFRGVFLNPKILQAEPACVPHEEGCLSLPELRERIYRPAAITVAYYDEKGQLQEKKLSGIVARIFQHEYDHLLGQLFIDYLSPLKKQLIRPKLREIQQGLIEAAYPTLHAV